MEAEFKKGDRVRIKKNCSGTKAGEECILGYDGADDKDLYALGKDGSCSCEGNWELVTSAKRPFEVGDKVVAVAAETWGWGPVKYGDVGIIGSIESGNNRYEINFNSMRGWVGKSSDIMLYEDFKKNESKPVPFTEKLVEPEPFKGMSYIDIKTTGFLPNWLDYKSIIMETMVGRYSLLNKLSKVTINRKETTMQKLTKALKRLFSAEQAKMYEARLIKQDGSLTEAGMASVIDFVSQQEDCKKFLLKEAQTIIDEEKEGEDED